MNYSNPSGKQPRMFRDIGSFGKRQKPMLLAIRTMVVDETGLVYGAMSASSP
jgi:hypothetical protein